MKHSKPDNDQAKVEQNRIGDNRNHEKILDSDNLMPMPGEAPGAYIPQPDGSTVAPNGAVVRNPLSDKPEVLPDNEYTPEKEDLNLLIM